MRNFFGSGRARPERQRRLAFERLEERNLLALTHLYTFNDGSANDWIGSAHGTLVNGATVADGQLVLSNQGVLSGQSGLVQHARLGANVLPSGAATVEVWFTAAEAADWTRVFDIGSQLAGNGESYLFLTPQSAFGDARAALRPTGDGERIASTAPLDDGQEHMAAIVIDAEADLLRLYVDGVQVSTTPLDDANAGTVNDAFAYLGRSLFNADQGFTGSINELRIYDHARSAEEVAAAATAGPSNAIKSPLVRQMEHLDRGLVAVRRATNQIYIGWRLFGTDPANIAFNLYRSSAGGAPQQLNTTPLTATTDFVDTTANGAVANVYFVRPVIDGVEQEPSESFTLAPNTPVQQFLNVPLQIPAGGVTPSGENYTYNANDASVGDVDGDGQYEIILKWDPSNAKDNSQSGYTGNVYIDAYKLDGTLLWRIDLGRNIRAGAHYTQFMVYDLDGDGRAEVAMKTAPGTIDGQGNFVLLPGDNAQADYRNSSGYILAGPEYLTVFDGLTGAALDTVPYLVPRHPVTQNPTSSQLNEIWGDGYGNRVDRFLAGVAYLDGVRPSLVMARGYYTRSAVAAWDFRDGRITQRWLFDTTAGRGGGQPAYEGQGAHSLSIADVDGDGKDEIIYGAMVIDDHGVGLHTTGLGHGDALHVSDMDPNRPGLEIFMPHESPGSNGQIGASLRDAATGQILASLSATSDVGRGVAADIWAGNPGYEFWASGGGIPGSAFSTQGAAVGRRPSTTNFLVWWDADPVRELFDGQSSGNGAPRIDKYGPSSDTRLLTMNGAATNNGTKSNPALIADILGDWREEVIVRASNNSALRIYTTTTSATNRLYTLMHDSQYRSAIAWQNVAYNQPAHPSFFLGAGMAPPPTPQIYTVEYVPPAPRWPGDYNGDQSVDAADYSIWRDTLGSTTDLRADGNDNGIVDEEDYAIWRQNFGTSVGGLAAHIESMGRAESLGAGSTSESITPRSTPATDRVLAAWPTSAELPNLRPAKLAARFSHSLGDQPNSTSNLLTSVTRRGFAAQQAASRQTLHSEREVAATKRSTLANELDRIELPLARALSD